MAAANHGFEFVVERDEEGWYVGYVPELPRVHTQAQTRAQLRRRMREAVEAYVLAGGRVPTGIRFVGVESVRGES